MKKLYIMTKGGDTYNYYNNPETTDRKHFGMSMGLMKKYFGDGIGKRKIL